MLKSNQVFLFLFTVWLISHTYLNLLNNWTFFHLMFLSHLNLPSLTNFTPCWFILMAFVLLVFFFFCPIKIFDESPECWWDSFDSFCFTIAGPRPTPSRNQFRSSTYVLWSNSLQSASGSGLTKKISLSGYPEKLIVEKKTFNLKIGDFEIFVWCI